MKCLNVISVSWSKILFTRTDYKFGVALFFFFFYKVNMATKSAKYLVIKIVERVLIVKRPLSFEKKDKSR